MPLQVLREFEQTFGVRILEGYGLSETAPVVAFNQLDRPSKPGTVGLPVFGVEIRCVDEHDIPQPPGSPGEILVRGPNVMKGYYENPDATAEAKRGGWFRTGDIGQFDEDGYLSIVDRRKDIILRGGFNVYPREVEEVLMTHPAVAVAAVVGLPDERLGERVAVAVQLRDGATVTEDELREHCLANLARYKVPERWLFVEGFPRNSMGKIQRRELLALFTP